MPGRIHIRTNARWIHSSIFPERGAVARGDLSAPGQVGLKFFELLKAQSATDVGQPVVETQQHHVVLPLARGLALPGLAADPVIAEAAKSFREMRVIRRDHPAF